MPSNGYSMPSHRVIIQAIKKDPVFQRAVQDNGVADINKYYDETIKDGVCNGITALFLQQASMHGVEQAANSMNNLLSDKNQFQLLIDFLIQFIFKGDKSDDKTYQSKFSGLNIIGSYQQSSEQDQDDLVEDLMIKTGQENKDYTRKFHIPGTELANALGNIPEKTMCKLLAVGTHTTAAYKENGQLYFYDSNRAAAVVMTAADIAEQMSKDYGKDCGNEFHLMLMSKSPIPTESVEKLQSAQMARFNQFDYKNPLMLYIHKYLIKKLPLEEQAEAITKLTQIGNSQASFEWGTESKSHLATIIKAVLVEKHALTTDKEPSVFTLAAQFVNSATSADADPRKTQQMFLELTAQFNASAIVPDHPKNTATSLVHDLKMKSSEIYNPKGNAEGGAPILEGETAEFRQQRLEQDIRILKKLGGDEGLFLGKNNGLISHSQRQQAIKAYFVSEYGGPTTELDRLKADIDNMHKQDGDISKFLGNERRLINHDDRQQVINRENEPGNTTRRGPGP